MNIIIIEDEGITALFLKETLEDLNHNVINIFDNGNDLIKYLTSNNNIDLIFMDINIKGKIDGIELAKIVKKEYSNISFVFLTSYKDKETIGEAKLVKPLGYIIKPVIQNDIEAVMMVVESTKVIDDNSIKYIKVGKYVYDVDLNILLINKSPVLLGKNELICMKALILNTAPVISAKDLMKKIWINNENNLSSLRELISRLRKKLPGLEINSIPNIGYSVNKIG